MEEWRIIPGFDYYLVSNLGRVKSTLYGRERILKPFYCGRYLAVWLGAGNKKYIHHLVAKIFLEEVEGFEIDHINRHKEDNRLCNLRWTTKSDNMKNRGPHIRDAHFKQRYGKKIFYEAHIVNT